MKNMDEKIKEIKSKEYDEQEIKEALKKTQKYLKKLAGDYRSEGVTVEEIKEEAEKELQKNLLAVPQNGFKLYDLSAKYRTVKELLKMEKRDTANFYRMVNQARELEQENPNEELYISLDMKKVKLSLLRNVIRTCKIRENKDILTALHNGKGITEKEIKEKQKKALEAVFSGLETYGIIDEYIDRANLVLKEENVKSVSFAKKLGLADSFSNDRDEIGLYDVLDDKFLQSMSVEDVNLFSAFWQSEFLQYMQEMSTGIGIVNDLNLWQEIIDGTETDIDKIDIKKIIPAIQKSKLIILIKDMLEQGEEKPEELQKEYNKFLKEEGLKEENLQEGVNRIKKITKTLENVLKNIITMKTSIIQDIKTNNMSIKEWGKIEENDEFVLLGINNANFIGPVTMELNKETLEDWLNKIGNRKLPEYKQEFNPKNSAISNVYMPKTQAVKSRINKESKHKPNGVLEFLR